MSIYLEMLQRRYEKLYHTEAGGEREYASWYDVFCFLDEHGYQIPDTKVGAICACHFEELKR
jgi:hypothetical protein